MSIEDYEVPDSDEELGGSTGTGVRDSNGMPALIDLFKEEVVELEQNRDVLIPVPGYARSGVQIKYMLPESGKQLDEIARRAKREAGNDQFKASLITSMDTMIKLCMGVYVQPADANEPVMLDPQELGYAVKFDERLSELLGLDDSDGNGSARRTLRKLFGNNDSAIFDHSERLSRWIRNTKANLAAEVWQLGEV